MWSRAILKNNAKAAIRGGKYGLAFLVSALIMIVPELIEWISGYEEVYDKWVQGIRSGVPLVERSVILGYNIAYLLLNILVVLPLVVGIYGFFVRNRFDAGKFSDAFMGFRNGYGNVVITSAVTNLFIALWTLLLIIPGIYKLYQYILVPFLLSDNPKISGGRARQISRMMTDGEKSSIFVLTLSFLGWYALVILGVMFLGMLHTPQIILNGLTSLGLCLIAPYFYASMAEMYIFLRDRAIQTGMVQPEELNLVG